MRKVGHWALLGMEQQAKERAASNGFDKTSKARSRLVEVWYYPRSQRLAYHTREGVVSKSVALMELEKEVKLDGLY